VSEAQRPQRAAKTVTKNRPETNEPLFSTLKEDRREAYYYQRMRESSRQYLNFDLRVSEATLNLLDTYDVLHQTASRYMAEYGLSKSTINVLVLLHNGPADGMQLHDLGALLLVSRANITGLIDHLEEKGYVTRVVDSHDRRARFARITKKGETILDEFMPVHHANLNLLLQDMSDDEREKLVSLLKKMRASITAHAHEVTADPCAGTQRTMRS
jgi:MarR family 2-MHQ and catechol resistance regulon transcriptional repressor